MKSRWESGKTGRGMSPAGVSGFQALGVSFGSVCELVGVAKRALAGLWRVRRGVGLNFPGAVC